MDKDSIREVEMKGLTLGAELPARKVYEESPECPFKTSYCVFRMSLSLAHPELQAAMATLWKEENKKEPEIKERDEKGRILPSAQRGADGLDMGHPWVRRSN